MSVAPFKKTFLTVLAFGLFVQIGSSNEPRYTYTEVRDACINAYHYAEQINQCIQNVCGTYGCSQEQSIE